MYKDKTKICITSGRLPLKIQTFSLDLGLGNPLKTKDRSQDA